MSSKALTSNHSKRLFVINGLALFSMFFGAGNVIFPLIIGQNLATNIPFAILGLFLTAIIIPFCGIVSTALFEGNYYNFFQRMGRFPGSLLIIVLFALIGPLGGIPRLIGLSFSSVKIYVPNLHILTFSLISCVVLFFLAYRKNKIIDLLGYVLTPLLLIGLGFVIIKGILSGSDGGSGLKVSPLQAFYYGLKEGYNTMDLLASFFFSSFIYHKANQTVIGVKNKNKAIFSSLMKSSAIGIFLLSLVYSGFAYLAFTHTGKLSTVSSDQLLGKIGHLILGPYAGLAVCLIVLLSCLTTAIALTALFTDFLRDQFKEKKPPYWLCLLVVLTVAFFVSTLKFNGIVLFLSPILEVIYPSLVVLCVFNILNKIYKIETVKTPFYFTLFIVLITSILSLIK